jgi:hypothetical protein
MQFGSINIVVNDPDEALGKWLKLIGTNNVSRVLKIKGLDDTTDIVDGYYLHTNPVHIGLWKPRESNGRMAQFLKKNGEGIHHMTFHMGQEEFLIHHKRLKSRGWPVSEKPIFLGLLTEAIFWVGESSDQEVPVKFQTKCNHTFYPTDTGGVHLDTPKSCEVVNITEEHIRPRVDVVTVVVVCNDLEKQIRAWSTLTERFPLEMGGIGVPGPHIRGAGNDYRGNLFEPVSYLFDTGDGGRTQARINQYQAVGGPENPINKVLAHRGANVMYHNITCVVQRDKFHGYWEQLEDAGFNMLDPKPPLLLGTGNYFFFTHPSSTHSVLHEFVSLFKRDEAGQVIYDYNGVEAYMVPPGTH